MRIWSRLQYLKYANEKKVLVSEEYITMNLIEFELNGFNGHFRNNAYNSVRWGCLVSLAPVREKGSTIQYGYRK